jgi:hypothetical protein
VADPSFIPLDADAIAEDVVRRTGLEDFGGDAFWEPYRLFVASVDDEAQLHAIGRLLVRDDLRNWLENRLRLTDWRKRHPEISREEVEAPLFITGLPRTGTSILHELLAQDPVARAPRHWEVRYPCPPPKLGAQDDPRIAIADTEVQLWNEVVPEYKTMHELGATIPVECIQITAHEFRSDELLGRQQVPRYGAWLAGADFEPAYAFHRRFLQHLQWHRPGERWVLKAPSHLGQLRALFAVYPDARVVQTHRDPLKVLPSVASILYSTAWVRSDAVDPEAVLGWFSGDTCAYLLDQAAAFRDAGTAAPERFHDVRYADLMTQPFETLGALYDAFGLRFTAEAEARMRAYLSAKPQGKHGAHRYAFDATGLDAGEERERFRAYQERYGVPSEV